MRSAFQISLPWPPSMNSYWTPFAIPGTKRATMTLTKRARMYRSEVSMAIRQKVGSVALVPFVGAVRLDVELRAPDRRIRDLDNNLKGLLDSLTFNKVWRDDSQVDEMTVRRGAIIRDGAALIIVTALEDQPELVPAAADVDPFA